jgi:hypothetical protein
VAPVPVAPGGIKPNSALATKQMTYANTAGLGGVENHQKTGGEKQVGDHNCVYSSKTRPSCIACSCYYALLYRVFLLTHLHSSAVCCCHSAVPQFFESTAAVSFPAEAAEAFKQLKLRRRHRAVSYRVDNESAAIVIDQVS